MIDRLPLKVQFVLALGVSTLVSVGLFAYGVINHSSFSYGYLLWNLFLAWLPLVFVLWLLNVLKRKRWSSWEGIAASLLWFLFLPNSFYMISDYIHLQEAPDSTVLYDAVMFTSFVITAAVLGFGSLYLVHRELGKRLQLRLATLWVGGVLLACSFAIYIGRDLRWNSWDVLFNPGGLLFDISDRLITPQEYPELLRTTLSFWALLSSQYLLGWWGGRLLHRVKNP